METIELAPKGCTWDFAYDMLRKFFLKKTGMSWEDALSGDVGGDAQKNERWDSGIDMNPGCGCAISGKARLGVVDEMSVDDHAGASFPGTLRTPNLERPHSTTTPDTIATSPLPFTYTPNSTEHLDYFGKKYANRYGEDWLPASTPQPVSPSSQEGKIESEEVLMDLEEEQQVLDAGASVSANRVLEVKNVVD